MEGKSDDIFRILYHMVMVLIITQMVAYIRGRFFKVSLMGLGGLLILMEIIMKGRLSMGEQMGKASIKIRILRIKDSLKIIKSMEKELRKQITHIFRVYFNMTKKQKEL